MHLSELLLGVSPHSGVLWYVFTHMHVYICVEISGASCGLILNFMLCFSTMQLVNYSM